MTPPRVLTVAGSDPSGGAGLQADLKTFHAFGCGPPAAFVDSQIAAIVEDCPPAATKTGMLFTREVIEVVVRWAERGALGRLIVDPVMVATSGDALLQPDAEEVLRDRLLPLAMLVTPNVPEAESLQGSGSSVTGASAIARALADRLGTSVLLKGGHGTGEVVRDALATPGEETRVWERSRLPVGAAHGTGCTLSAAIAAGLALGHELETAVGEAGDFVHHGLRDAFAVGAGAIPVNHLCGRPESVR